MQNLEYDAAMHLAEYYKRELDKARADVAFMASRIKITGGYMSIEPRSWGLSSNSICALAYGVNDSPLEMPLDASDLAACERMVNLLPEHRRTPIVIYALNLARKAVKP